MRLSLLEDQFLKNRLVKIKLPLGKHSFPYVQNTTNESILILLLTIVVYVKEPLSQCPVDNHIYKTEYASKIAM